MLKIATSNKLGSVEEVIGEQFHRRQTFRARFGPQLSQLESRKKWPSNALPEVIYAGYIWLSEWPWDWSTMPNPSPPQNGIQVIGSTTLNWWGW